jgi:TRAP transporter TAXI family solute receptor
MRRRRHIHPLRALAGAGFAAGLLLTSASGHAGGKADKRPVVRFLIGSAGGFDQRGFVAEYAKAMPDIALTLVSSTRGSGRLEELQDNDADLSINLASAAYLAYSGQFGTNARRFDRIRAITTLGVVPIHLVARRDSGIRTVADLRGRAVSLGTQGGELSRLARSIMSAYGVDLTTVRTEGSGPAEVSTPKLRDGTLDAMFVVGGYPAESVRAATAGGAAYLVPMEGAAVERLRLTGRFFKVTLIPAETYAGQTGSVRTMGVQNILLVRRDLDEQVVYELTKQFFSCLPRLSVLVSSLRSMELEQASATPIPLHEGAARYYRERELFR